MVLTHVEGLTATISPGRCCGLGTGTAVTKTLEIKVAMRLEVMENFIVKVLHTPNGGNFRRGSFSLAGANTYDVG